MDLEKRRRKKVHKRARKMSRAFILSLYELLSPSLSSLQLHPSLFSRET